MDLITENWQTIVGVIGLVTAAFFPKVKPIIDSVFGDGKGLPSPVPQPRPVPIDLPIPPSPDNRHDLNRAFDSAIYLVDYFAEVGNIEGEEAARLAGQYLFKAQPEGIDE